MKKVLLAVLASAALTGTAVATEAFIGQQGNGNDGLNIQLNQGPASTSLAVIYQGNNGDVGPGTNGHDALQVQIGDNNDAYTYQTSDFYDHVALSWQEGTGNDSVNVQVTSGDTGPNTAPFKARTIQLGDNNSAVNWQSDDLSEASLGMMTLNPTAPSLSLTGDTIPILAQNPSASAANFDMAPPVDF